MIPAAKGATSIRQWDETADSGAWDDTALYDDMQARVEFALGLGAGTGTVNRVVAVLWHQGEADLGAALRPDDVRGYPGSPERAAFAYTAHLGALVQRLRRDLPGRWPFITAHLAPSLIPIDSPAFPVAELFAEARRSLALAKPRVGVVETGGLVTNAVVFGSTEKSHFTGASQIELADRLFASFLSLSGIRK